MTESNFPCDGCGKRLQFRSTGSVKRVQCPHCGAVSALPRKSQSPAEQGEESAAPGTKETVRRRTGSGTRVFVGVLLALYFPFLAMLGLAAFALAIWLFSLTPRAQGVRYPLTNFLGVCVVLIGLATAATVLQVVQHLFTLLRQRKTKDPLAFEFPDQWQEPLMALIEEVAEKGDLPEPDRIQLHAADVAHVYEDKRGRYVLAIGALAVAALPQRSLAGVIAHELGHFAEGDTALSQLASRWHQVMALLDYFFCTRPWLQFNPVTWAIRCYHHVYGLAWCANSRGQEFVADQHTVELIGAEQTAATLMLIEVLHNIPWANLQVVAEQFIESNERPKDLFAEQVRRVKSATPSEWDEAMRKSLKHRTKPFDTHPCLKQRLKALGVAPKAALRIAMDLSGAPSTDLFANWPVVEKFLSDRIFNLVREIYWERREFEDFARAVVRNAFMRDA